MKHCNLKVIYWPIYQLNTAGYKKALIIDLFWLSLVYRTRPLILSESTPDNVEITGHISCLDG